MDDIRVLIVEDEPLARRRLVNLLKDRPGYEIAGECGDGQTAVKAIVAQSPDLILLDVQMPEMNGFEVLEALDPDCMPAIIFVTAYDEYALHAFEVHALDYLLKPFDDERLEKALACARERIHHHRIDGLGRQLVALAQNLQPEPPAEYDLPPSPDYLERIALKSSDRIVLLKVDDIDWVEGAGVYVKLHAGEKTHLLRDTLKHLECSLDPARFMRIHRSTIVNVDRIKELTSYFHGEYLVLLEDGTQLKLSRTYRDRLEALVGNMG